MQQQFKTPLCRLTLAITLTLPAVTFTGCDYFQTFTDAQYVERAKVSQKNGNLNESVLDLKSALQKNPNNIEARQLLGEINLRFGNGADAEKELRRAMELGMKREYPLPYLAKALLMQKKNQQVIDEIDVPAQLGLEEQAKLLAYRGEAFLGLGKQSEAKGAFERALTIDNRSAWAKVGLARISVLQGEGDKALLLLNEAIDANPNEAEIWNFKGEVCKAKNDLAQAEASYTKALELSISNQDKSLNRAARALVRFDAMKYAEAGQDLEILKKQAPTYYLTHHIDGLLLLEQKKFAEAQAALDEALKENPLHASSLYYSGLAHLEQNHLEQAEQNLAKFLIDFPNSVQAHKLMAMVKFKQGDYTNAQSLLKPVLDFIPEDYYSLSLMGNIDFALGHLSEGLERFKKIAELAPKSTEAKLQLGSSMLRAGQTEKGLAVLELTSKMDDKLIQPDIIIAETYLKAKEYEKALEAVDRLKKKMPDNIAPINLQALIYAKKGDANKAKEAMEEVLKMSPGDPSSSNNLAQLAIREKKYDEARQLYLEALEKHPKHLLLSMSLAELDALEGKTKAMENLLRETIKDQPQALQPRLMLARHSLSIGDLKQAQSLLEEIRSLYPMNPELLTALTEAQLADRQAFRALETAKLLADVMPKSAKPQYLLGQAYAENNDPKGVKTSIERCLELDPHFFLARVAMVRLLVQQKKIDEANHRLMLLAKEEPDSVDVMALQAWVADQQNHTEEAISAYGKALAKQPSSAFAIDLAKVQWKAGKREDAIATLQNWGQQNPKDEAALVVLVNLLSAQRHEKEAQQTLEKIVELNPKNAWALNGLAWFIRQSDPTKALEYAEKAHELAPKYALTADTLAMLLLEKNIKERALNLLASARDLAPENPSIRYHWALALERNERGEEAANALKDLLAANKDFPERQDAETLLKKLTH